MTLAVRPDDLTTYRLLQRLPVGRSYALRILAICFVGIHVPLVVTATFLIAEGGLAAHLRTILVLLLATVAGTGATLVLVYRLLAPVRRATAALDAYLERRTVPTLPLVYGDEAGRLMASVRVVLEELDAALRRQERLAATDPLTGLSNRRAFFDGATAVLSSARRGGVPVALVVLDIDRFKGINDTWGHKAGDLVIRAVAEVLTRATRTGELVGRLGGEEFALLLPGSDADTAADRAESLRRAVGGLAVEACRGRAVTVSIGVAVIDPAEEATIDAALERADHALYESKEAGRDRVTLAA